MEFTQYAAAHHDYEVALLVSRAMCSFLHTTEAGYHNINSDYGIIVANLLRFKDEQVLKYLVRIIACMSSISSIADIVFDRDTVKIITKLLTVDQVTPLLLLLTPKLMLLL